MCAAKVEKKKKCVGSRESVKRARVEWGLGMGLCVGGGNRLRIDRR